MIRIRSAVDIIEKLIVEDDYSYNDEVISLYDYVERVVYYSYPRCDTYIVGALVLMDRITLIKRTSVHLMFYLSYFFASVYLCDYKLDMKRCFAIAGVSKEVFTTCLTSFLQRLDYNISISKEDYDNKLVELQSMQ